ncbi:hypothetical protein QAD02_008219 [Eretmocerus hayati]|uniref:Uncharacterized protein n=1 Tax=Eretmocerus hayati TaxID=131215 RepID=A0ACC2N5X6_9HYME|nr:hypothetical protein QAD02_008219 [Eretmocerus hayati]
MSLGDKIRSDYLDDLESIVESQKIAINYLAREFGSHSRMLDRQAELNQNCELRAANQFKGIENLADKLKRIVKLSSEKIQELDSEFERSQKKIEELELLIEDKEVKTEGGIEDQE